MIINGKILLLLGCSRQREEEVTNMMSTREEILRINRKKSGIDSMPTHIKKTVIMNPKIDNEDGS